MIRTFRCLALRVDFIGAVYPRSMFPVVLSCLFPNCLDRTGILRQRTLQRYIVLCTTMVAVSPPPVDTDSALVDIK